MKMILAFLALFCGTAAAHEIGVSRSTWQADPTVAERVQVEFALARGEALALEPQLDADRDGHLVETELPALRPSVEALLADLKVSQRGASCRGRLGSFALAEADGLVVRADFSRRCFTAGSGWPH